MGRNQEKTGYRLGIKILSVFLAFVTVLSTGIITGLAQAAGVPEKTELNSVLSDYVEEIVDLDDVESIDLDQTNESELYFNMEDGTTTVYSFSEPVTFTDEEGNIECKDNSIVEQSDGQMLSQGYDFCNGKNDFRINLSTDSSKGVMAQYGDISFAIAPVSDITAPGYISSGNVCGEDIECFQYNDLFGDCTTLRYYPQINGVKAEIVLDNAIDKSVYEFNLNVTGCEPVVNEDGTLSLIDSNNQVVQTFAAPFAYDAQYVQGVNDEHYTGNCSYSVEKTGEGAYILSLSVDEDWLFSDTTVYPVTIDPTTSHIGNMYDLPIHSKRTTTGATVDNNAVGTSSQYGTSRSLIKFQKPSAIKAYATINSAYYYTRELTGRTSSFACGVYKITSSWNENSLWSTRPSYNTTKITSRNINGNSADIENSPYWYKFNLKSLVQQWYTGTANYGFMLKYENESAAAKNLRTFAQEEYSTSAWRPYTVINYTNDTTVPTAKSVTGNKTEWTNKSITLTVNGAADNAGGSGLAAKAYSFSTTKGSYAWQTSNKFSVSSNKTIYVYVKDKAGNIRLVSTENITCIDVQAPVINNVNGNPTVWQSDDVTLTVDDAQDDASGLANEAYSFSKIKDSYSWQESNSCVFSENDIVYVSVRDKANNITTKTIKVSKIDKTPPSAPEIVSSSNGEDGGITVKAYSTDDISGVSKYSFSKKAGVYNWTDSDTAVFNDTYRIYAYSMDNAGNISEMTVSDIKADNTAPNGGIVTGNSDVWTQSVTLTAENVQDEESGLNETAYSFSTAAGEYDWQESNSKTFTSNATVYVYVRDTLENIQLVDTVVIDKIDRGIPTLKNVTIEDNGDTSTAVIDAADSISGIEAYSFDNGQTWQESNTYTYNKGKHNYFLVKVRDKAGNVSLIKKVEINTPKVYYENNLVGLYNPNPKCPSYIYYRYGNLDSWKFYDKPFKPTQKTIQVSFSNDPIYIVNQKSVRISDFETEINGKYSENNIDANLTYNNISFDIARIYDNKNNDWFYSFNSNLTINEEESIITAVMPTGEKLLFVTKDINKYENELTDYVINVERADNGAISSYKLFIDEQIYNYNSNGVLVSVCDKYDDIITLSRIDKTVIISDETGRRYIVNLNADDDISYILDPAGNYINYCYENGLLVSVSDQSNTIIGKYEYVNGFLSKSMDKTIYYNEAGQVSKFVYDSGANCLFTYDGNSVSAENSDGESYTVKYDEYNRILSYTDSNGDTTSYSYDNFDNIKSTSVNGQTKSECTYYYDYDINKPTYFFSTEDNIKHYYHYDADGKLLCEEQIGESEKNYFYYDYNEFGDVVVSATLKENYEGDIPLKYDPQLDCYETTTYQYTNGLVTKITGPDNTVIYNYDEYGNVLKTQTTSTAESGETSVQVTDNTYDIMGNVLSEKSGDSLVLYTYDSAGKVLLKSIDGVYQRTVYDNYGRTIQEIDDSDYNPEIDDVPNAYPDTAIGHRYVYNNAGQLIKEINKYNLETDYTYSSIGKLNKKHFDVYDYYYSDDGSCCKVEVNGAPVVSYDYNVTDSDITVSDGQQINRMTYADGYTEEQVTDKNGTVKSKYSDGSAFYSVSVANSIKAEYNDLELGHVNTYKTTENGIWYSQKTSDSKTVFGYGIETQDDVQTISETHFGTNNYQTVISNNTASFTSPSSSFEYNVVSNDGFSAEQIKDDGTVVLSADTTYNEDSDIISKSYGNNLVFTASYDYSGNIIADENRNYTYNEYGELVSVSGSDNSSYTYDDRGNMLTKTVNGQTTEFVYNNDEWQDQLTSVNGAQLTYDLNGNLTAYGNTQYSWSRGKQLRSISDGENSYTYKYDSKGIRASKTVNGVTTNYDTLDGRVLAQYDGTNNIYFQYNGNSPVGFILNNVQYYYITNLYGDVMGIADSDGNVIARYAYDEWGKLLDIETAQENSEEQMAIAEINPLRYRGYYYDNETGMYYLQSRYYNPDLCRFISADGFEFISNKTKLNVNAYLYCVNNPVNYIDPFGNSYVSKAGKAISDLIAIIFVSLEAEARGLGEDFVYLIASYFTNHVDDLYYKRDKNKKKDQANKRKARAKFDKIFESLVDDFIKLTKTAFYKVVKAIKPNFFFEFFKKSVKEHSDLIQISIDKNITITFGYGVADEFYALIQDIVDRHLKLITIGGVDLGTILGPDLGVYIDHQKEIANDFFASLTIELEGNFIDFYPPNPGAAVNTEYTAVAAYSALMALIILATGGLVCLV